MFSESATAALDCDIKKYATGNAFARWLVPDAGATKLGIGCEVREGDKVLATATAERSVLAGGGYIIGAWATLFSKVANDLVGEIKRSLRLRNLLISRRSDPCCYYFARDRMMSNQLTLCDGVETYMKTTVHVHGNERLESLWFVLVSSRQDADHEIRGFSQGSMIRVEAQAA